MSIRRIRRKMDSFHTGNSDSANALARRVPRSSRIGCCEQNTLVGRVNCVEEDVVDINCALAKQAVVLNDHECRLECKQDKKCCEKKKKCCDKKKKCCDKKKKCCKKEKKCCKKKKCCRITKCCVEKKCCNKSVCCEQVDPCNPCCTQVVTVCCSSSSSSSCCSSSSSSCCSSSSSSSSSCSSSSCEPQILALQGFSQVLKTLDNGQVISVEARGTDLFNPADDRYIDPDIIEAAIYATYDQNYVNDVAVDYDVQPYVDPTPVGPPGGSPGVLPPNARLRANGLTINGVGNGGARFGARQNSFRTTGSLQQNRVPAQRLTVNSSFSGDTRASRMISAKQNGIVQNNAAYGGQNSIMYGGQSRAARMINARNAQKNNAKMMADKSSSKSSSSRKSSSKSSSSRKSSLRHSDSKHSSSRHSDSKHSDDKKKKHHKKCSSSSSSSSSYDENCKYNKKIIFKYSPVVNPIDQPVYYNVVDPSLIDPSSLTGNVTKYPLEIISCNPRDCIARDIIPVQNNGVSFMLPYDAHTYQFSFVPLLKISTETGTTATPDGSINYLSGSGNVAAQPAVAEVVIFQNSVSEEIVVTRVELTWTDICIDTALPPVPPNNFAIYGGPYVTGPDGTYYKTCTTQSSIFNISPALDINGFPIATRRLVTVRVTEGFSFDSVIMNIVRPV